MNGLKKFGIALLLLPLMGCAEGSSTEPPPADELPFPVAVAVHPAGYALVATSNFDMRYQAGMLLAVDLNTLAQRINDGTAADTDNRDLILAEQAITIPSFAGSMELVSSAERGLALVSCRQTNQVLLVDLQLDDNAPPGEGLQMSCWNPDSPPSGASAPKCQGSRYVLDLDHEDPFSMLVLPGQDEEQTPWEERTWSAWVSYLRDGTLSEVEVTPGRPNPQEPPRLRREVDSESKAISNLTFSPLTQMIYASSRFNEVNSNALHYFSVLDGDEPTVYTLQLFDLVLGNQTRDLAFTPDGRTLMVLVRDPDQLVFIDASPGPDGRPRHRLTGQVVLDDNPARLLVAGELVIITDAESDVVAFVDSRTGRLLRFSEDICRGPYDVALWQPEGRTLGVVACFEEDVLAVVDLDRNSPSFLQLLAKVGKSREEK